MIIDLSCFAALGFPSNESICKKIAKQRLIERRGERMNDRLSRRRDQILKRRIAIFLYLLAIPIAITALSWAWKLAIISVMQ